MTAPNLQNVMLRGIAESLLYTHPFFSISRHFAGVLLPESEASKPYPFVILQIGTNMRNPIRDLELNDHCISCTLSFGGTPSRVRIPWEAVCAISTCTFNVAGQEVTLPYDEVFVVRNDSKRLVIYTPAKERLIATARDPLPPRAASVDSAELGPPPAVPPADAEGPSTATR